METIRKAGGVAGDGQAAALHSARAYLLQSAELKRQTAEQCAEAIVAAAGMIARAFREGGKVLLCGNGGSAADCQHVASELINLLTTDFARPPLPAVALTTDSSALTACANDSGFDTVFARQVQALGRPGDVLVGISTSGNSRNVLRAVEVARTMRMYTVGLTGSTGQLRGAVDIAIAVPATDVQHTQEAHLAIEHLLCHLIERELFGGESEGGRRIR